MNIEDIAQKLIDAMCGDNGYCFNYRATPARRKVLEYGIVLMQKEGVSFNKDSIFQMICGEHTETFNIYGRYKGWVYLDNALNVIFDGGELMELPNE